MARISKQPDERKAELMETAERLFIEKGFASVRVSDIVSAMGVAQGTFYYYFQSKDEVMVALLEQKWMEIARLIAQKLAAEPDPVARLAGALAGMVMPGGLAADPHYRLLFDPAVTGAFHPEFDTARVKSLLPVMRGVIEYGIAQGVFPQYENMREVVRIVFLGISAYFHQTETEVLPAALPAVCELIEHVLDLPKGTLNTNLFEVK